LNLDENMFGVRVSIKESLWIVVTK
jgi:hypothetical protein